MRASQGSSGVARHRCRGGIVAGLVVAIGVLAVLAAGYVVFVLHWSYSEGERAGILQKFSRKGWVFKTWEGELAMSIVPGVTPTIWDFSVRDPRIADQMSAALGKRVALHYTEHRGVPSRAFADTRFYVDRVRLIE